MSETEDAQSPARPPSRSKSQCEDDTAVAEPGEVLTITCGQVVARLHMERFICPGIHQECIEVESGVFVTPKMFAVMGEKEKLKDWKNAIRLNGRSIRKRMDAGELDFTRHDEICTGRCASRNLGGSKYDVKIENLQKGQLDISNETPPPAPSTSTTGKSGRSRHKGRRPSQSPDLASLKTLLSGHALNEPGYSALRKAQGSEPTTLPAHSPPALYSNQPVFPSAIMVPADQEIKSEPTSQCDENPEQSSTSKASNNPPSESTSPKSNPRSLSASPVPLTICPQSGDEDSREGEEPSYPAPREVSHQINGTCLGPSSVSQPVDYSVSSHTPTPVPTIAPAPANKVVEINREMMEAIKFASDLPDADSLLEDSVQFWQSILDLGLLDNFFREIKRELDALRHDFHSTKTPNPKSAQQLSNIVTELGLMTKLKWRLAQAKSATEKEKEDLNTHIELLKKRVAESEQKQLELKRKSETFESLMEIGRVAKRARTSTPNSCVSTNSSSADDSKPT